MGRILLLLGVAALASCQDSVWNVPMEVWKKAGVSGDYSFLVDLEIPASSLSQGSRLAPGSLYYLGKVLDGLGRRDVAGELWNLSLNSDPFPWGTWSAQELSSRLIGSKSWEELETLAQTLVRRFPEFPLGKVLAAEAWYWLQKDKQYLDLAPRGGDGESKLRLGVVTLRLGLPQALELWKDFILNSEASGLHYRAYTFFEQNPLRYGILGDGLGSLLVFKAMVAEKKSEAQIPAEKLMDLPLAWSTPALVADWEDYFRPVSRRTEGLALLKRQATLAQGAVKSRIHQALGHLYETAGRSQEAASWYQKSLDGAQDPAQVQKLYLKFLASRDVPGFLGSLENLNPDPSLLKRELEELLSTLVREKKYSLISRGWRWISLAGTPSQKADWALVMLRLTSLKLLSPDQSILDPQGLESQVALWEPLGYPGALLGSLAGKTWQIPPGKPVETPTGPDQSLPWLGFLDFGLGKPGFDKFWEEGKDLPRNVQSSMARGLSSRGFHLEAARVLHRVLRTWGDLEPSDWKILYPLAFAPEMTQATREAGVTQELLRPLVREESFYDPAIKSPVGAVGLSQLMPATALDLERRMSLPPGGDLTDPLHNLRLGSRYLADRLKEFGGPSKALMSYNAGPNRVKQWLRTFGTLGPELFVEAAPYPETRNYVKKIFITSWIYQGLYPEVFQTGPLALIYPELQ